MEVSKKEHGTGSHVFARVMSDDGCCAYLINPI
jgi:hypothetical protein